MSDEQQRQFAQRVDDFVQEGWKLVSFTVDPLEAIIRKEGERARRDANHWICRRLFADMSGKVQIEAIPCPPPFEAAPL